MVLTFQIQNTSIGVTLIDGQLLFHFLRVFGMYQIINRMAEPIRLRKINLTVAVPNTAQTKSLTWVRLRTGSTESAT